MNYSGNFLLRESNSVMILNKLGNLYVSNFAFHTKKYGKYIQIKNILQNTSKILSEYILIKYKIAGKSTSKMSAILLRKQVLKLLEVLLCIVLS